MQTLHFVLRGRPVPLIMLSGGKVIAPITVKDLQADAPTQTKQMLDCLMSVRCVGRGHALHTASTRAQGQHLNPRPSFTTPQQQCRFRTQYPQDPAIKHPPLSKTCRAFAVAPVRYDSMEEDRRAPLGTQQSLCAALGLPCLAGVNAAGPRPRSRAFLSFSMAQAHAHHLSLRHHGVQHAAPLAQRPS